MNLFVYCSGGFGFEVADLARRINRAQPRWERIGFLDDAAEDERMYGTEVYSLAVALERYGADAMEAVIANGEPFIRERLVRKLEASGVRLATIIDSTATVSETAIISEGAILFPGCYVSSAARLGRNSVMIAGSMLGHDVVLGDNSVISGHANVGGGCVIGHNSYIGMGAQVREQTRIGAGAIIGMGSIVFSDIPDEVIALGNPCRVVRRNDSKRIFNLEARQR